MDVELEFWPEYEGGLLWDRSGQSIGLETLPMPPELLRRLRVWKDQYDDSRLPIDGPGDSNWLEEGNRLLGQLRSSLGEGYAIWATEDWWDEVPGSKEYAGFIWIGEQPGIRLSLRASSGREALFLVEARYGKGHIISLANPDDAARPR